MNESRAIARSNLEKLVQHFEKNIYQFKAPTFNEAQTRQFLIDPFFDLLGWDISNKQMLPPYRIEVLPEGRVRTFAGQTDRNQEKLFSSDTAVKNEQKNYASFLEYIADDEYKAEQRVATKKPDYRFRIGGSTKFFVEAKKPSVDLMTSLDSIFQIKRYGFSARVPISILTDFEEFRVFDCTKRPFYDKPKIGVLKEFDLSWKTYLDEFDKLYDTFSREAVLGGSVETVQKKYLLKKTGEFLLDKSFLDDLSDWRVELAQDIAKHPKNRRIIDTHTLNECVQRILDRIVFLRVCEDRGIEETGTLLALLRLWQDHPGLSLYHKFNELVRVRRPLYNGLLFAEHESEQLEVGNKVLEKIFKNINYPLSPYHFDEIGVEILGSIYERFLGKTIRLTKKQVRVEEKPEVRKAGGVYYTPQYIVNYIVANTVGKLIEGKTPKQIAKLKIIDIACGSGSFLLGAFQKLIDYHVQWYTDHPEEVKESHGVRDAYEDALGQLHISARKKREILVNNIFGVDIDQQAVEVTQMSLYLKVLENENDATLNKPTMLALHEVLLPPLKNNIKCGNSLIGSDFLSQGDLFDNEARRKVNPFDWGIEFSEIMKNGGFDCVIGNPPYVRQETLGREFKEYARTRYKCFFGTADLYVYFIEQAHRIIRDDGLFGMICSGKFMRATYGKALRDLIVSEYGLLEIVDFGELPVFEDAATFPSIILTKRKSTPKQKFVHTPIKRLNFESLEGEIKREGRFLDETALKGPSWSLVGADETRVFEKIKSFSVPLRDYLKENIYRGLLTGLNEAFVIENSKAKLILGENEKYKELIKPFTIGDDVRRYHIRESGSHVIAIPSGWTRRQSKDAKNPWEWFCRNYPLLGKHLKPFQKTAMKRLDKGEFWWELRPCDYYHEFEKVKIVWPEIAKESRFSLDLDNKYLNKTCFFTVTNDLFLLGLLNSTIMWFTLKRLCSVLGDANKGGRLLQQKVYVEQIPICTIDQANPIRREVVMSVEKMIDLTKQLHRVSFDTEKEPIERQIIATNKKVDTLVYELYGLTDAEKAIVEGEK